MSRYDGVDITLIEAAAARGCDLCGSDFRTGGRVTIRGDEVLAVVCRSCVDRGVSVTSRRLH